MPKISVFREQALQLCWEDSLSWLVVISARRLVEFAGGMAAPQDSTAAPVPVESSEEDAVPGTQPEAQPAAALIPLPALAPAAAADEEEGEEAISVPVRDLPVLPTWPHAGAL